MKKIFIENLEAGMILGQDVFNDNGQLIIAEGTEVKENHIDYIKNLNLMYVIIQLPPEQMKRFVDQQKKDEALQEKYRHSVTKFKDIYKDIKLGSKLLEKDVDGIIMPLLEEIDKGANLVEKIWQIQQNDEYTFEHSVQVSIFSALMGKWLKLHKRDIKELAIAGLLHDLGKCNIPDSILNKPASLDDEEFNIMKNHPILGYMILIGSKDFYSDKIMQGVLQHHERCDGSGYPSALLGSQIHPYARLVAIADIYSAMTSDRVYRPKLCPFVVAEQMYQESQGQLDTFYCNMFLYRISQYFIGNHVRLSDGSLGKIIMCEKSHPHLPLVKVGNDFVDLIKRPDLRIEELLDVQL